MIFTLKVECAKHRENEIGVDCDQCAAMAAEVADLRAIIKNDDHGYVVEASVNGEPL
jgi:hypothetical protein